MVEIVFFLLGMCLGSFLNVIVLRVNEPHKYGDRKKVYEGIAWGRSKCPKCKKQIQWRDNIPLLSYIRLGGKCRNCRTTISLQYPIVEVLLGILWLGVATAVTNGVWSLSQAVFGSVILTLLAGLLISDLIFMTLPDVFMFPLFLLVVGLRIYSVGMSEWIIILPYIVSSLAAGITFFALWALTSGHGMGFGDVEYVVIMGLLLGFPQIIVGLFIAFLSGAIVGLGLLLWRRKGWKSKLPFGPFLILGTVVAWGWGEKILSWYLMLGN